MTKKLKVVNIVLATILITVMYLFVPTDAAEATDLKIKYGKNEITVKLLEDFSKSEVDQERVWRDGTVELKDGTILCEGDLISDSYLVTMPNADTNKDLYLNAKYIGLELKNACDGDIYYCFQCSIVDEESNKALINPFVGDEIKLVDKNGFSHEIVYSEGPTAYTRYGFIIPKGFDGYVLIPTNKITRFYDVSFDWETEEAIWGPELNLEGIGAHVSVGLNAFPEVDSSYVEFYIDNFFIFNEEFPTYEAPATPEPTSSPTPTVTPVQTASPDKTKTADITTSPNNNVSANKFPIWIPVVILVAVVLICIIVILKKK